jgi:YhcH/YjgK/YiaL family protein
MLPQAGIPASPDSFLPVKFARSTSWQVPPVVVRSLGTWAGFSEQTVVTGSIIMIVDRLEEAGQYSRLHPGFDAAFDLLKSTPFDELGPGRHEVMGESLFLIIDFVEGKGREAARLETHRKYIDVQYIIPGKGALAEQFGWRPTATCSQATSPFDKDKDIAFFGDQPELWFTLPPGYFAVFFPSDAHAPLAGRGTIRKAVVKVAVEW